MSDQRTKQDAAVQESFQISDSNNKLSEIRIVLIGGREMFGRIESGKSSVGNIILGKDTFVVGRRTAQSVQASANVHGRHVTVVDTPGWWWHYTLEDTSKFDLLEIKRSPTLCSPGPHVFLLVIPVDCTFHKPYRMALEKHLEFLSETVWHHIIVLFSSIAPYDDIALKKHLKKWPDLQMCLSKCQNRYHILNIHERHDSFQVIALLEKIEKMVVKNNEQYFQIATMFSSEEKRDNSEREQATKKIPAVKREKSELDAHIRGDKKHLSDIQILILGGTGGGKSSTGNTIMGKEVFKVSEKTTFHETVCCAVAHAKVHGRHLTVVDTPGWHYNHPLEKTPEMDKLEIRRSVYLCPPGPHVILLIVPVVTAFNRPVCRGVEGHMSLLGNNVWNHTIVLFTWGDWLGDTTIEERIEAEGEHLQWLLEQCGNRYHVFNCKVHNDSTQVTELFEKIEEMVIENNSLHFVPEMNENPSTEYNRKMKTAKTNLMKVSRQRDILQELLKERKYNLSDVRIVLLGEEKVGKSKFGNIILDGYFFKHTPGLGYQFPTTQCVMKQRKIEGYQVSVVDTPGWSTSTPENVKEILRSVTVCSPGPHAFLLVLPVYLSYTKKSQQTVEVLIKLFGENVLRHTIILFTDGQMLRDRPIEEYIACEGEALQELLRRCKNRYHVLKYNWSNRSQVRELLKMIEQMVARNRGEYFALVKKVSKPTATALKGFSGSKSMTEEEWMNREDELIDRMLEAAVVDLDKESKQSSHRRKQSIDGIIPSLAGDSGFSDVNSLFEVDLRNPVFKVSQWLRRPGNDVSSEYDTMSIVSSSQCQKMEVISDIPVPKQHPVGALTPVSGLSPQKRSRSSSI